MTKGMRSFLVLIGIGATLVSSCGENETYNLRLTANERTRIDTIYASRVGAIRAEIDSICDLQQDSLVQLFRDSIIKERLAEEALLRSRLPIPKAKQLDGQ